MSTDKRKQLLQDRQKAYKRVFGNEKDASISLVLEDLARFCLAEESCFHEDPRIHAVAEGRREVWLRIKYHLDKSLDELYDRYQEGRA